MPAAERIFVGNDSSPADPSSPGFSGIRLQRYVSSACGAGNLYTGTALFEPSATLPLHMHRVSEAITVLKGRALVTLGDQELILGKYDCLHVPQFTPHSVSNLDDYQPLLAHSAFAEPEPMREMLPESPDPTKPAVQDPPGLRRFRTIEKYQLSEGAEFCDLFAARFGSVGICGGYGCFQPGASLPCHTHHFDESITIVSGEALCLVEGRKYHLMAYDTAYVPEGLAHRFVNASNEPMAMVWVYGGNEPDRTIVDTQRCGDVSKLVLL